MKKKLISAAFVVAIALTAGYNVYNSQNKEALSDLALDNVEALASGEGGTMLPSGTCWGTAAGGGKQYCPGGRIICCWAHTDVFGEN